MLLFKRVLVSTMALFVYFRCNFLYFDKPHAIATETSAQHIYLVIWAVHSGLSRARLLTELLSQILPMQKD